MGIYTSGGLYFGRLLSQATRDRISDKMLDDYNMKLKDLKDARGRYILHPPECFVSDYYLNKERENKLIQNANANKERLIEFVKLISNGSSDVVGFYKIDWEFTTYSSMKNDEFLNLDDDIRVKNNIRVEL
jgi:hypothetical protein